MTGLRSLARHAGRIPTVLRTARHLRGRQVLAQVHHALFGIGSPRSAGDPTPGIAIAAPAVPYLPPPAHVKHLGPGRFELLAVAFEVPKGSDWGAARHGPLFAYHLHQHDYLRCADVSPDERAAVITDWIRSNPRGVGWDPHPTGLRLLAWGKLLTTEGCLPDDAVLRATMLCAMADQAETLSHNLETRLQANHLLSNLLCAVFAGLLIESPASESWLGRASRLRDELRRQIHADGGHEERSPMYHAALLEGVLDLLNLCRARPERAPAGLEAALAETASRMQAALELLCHGDGRIALFADAAFDIAAEPAALRGYADRLGVAPNRRGQGPFVGSARLNETGYVRLESGDWLVLASVAGPAPAHQPGHAHCDALAFELSLAGRRLVTDTGVCEYVPGERRRRSRATASHATVQIDGEEQAEVWAAHRVGGRPEVALVAWRLDGFAEATCRGWSRSRTLHRRRFHVGDREVVVEDSIEGPARTLRACLPIDPGFSVELRTGEQGAALAGVARSSGASAYCSSLVEPALVVEIELPAAFDWHIEQGAYYPGFGREVERSILVGIGRTCDSARTCFRRIG